MKSNRICIILFTITVLAGLSILPALAQESASSGKQKIAVFGFLNLTGDDTFDIPAETAGKGLTFALKTLGGYEVSEPANIARNFSNSTLIAWCAENGMDAVLYGVIQLASDGSEEYRLSVFDAAKKTTTVHETSKGQSVLDIFSVSDKLSAAVLGVITGRHIGFGSIAFSNSGVAGAYLASIDGILLADSPRKVDQVVNGTHRIQVFAGTENNRKEIYSAEVAVREGGTETVSFALQAAETPQVANTAQTSVRPEKIEMAYVTGGTFNNGKAKMTVSSFLIGKYEVTQKQYAAVAGNIPVACSAEYGLGDDYPVYYVNWYDAIIFCNKLSINEGLTPVYTINKKTQPNDWGSVPVESSSIWNVESISIWNAVKINAKANGYRLPTETEWEYAARGGSGDGKPAYSGSAKVNEVAWYEGNSNISTHPVGGKNENELGLFDMSGNVFEWCYDWYAPYGGAKTDYTGNASGAYRARIIRGGSWFRDDTYCTVAIRDYTSPVNSSFAGGFRVVRHP